MVDCRLNVSQQYDAVAKKQIQFWVVIAILVYVCLKWIGPYPVLALAAQDSSSRVVQSADS